MKTSYLSIGIAFGFVAAAACGPSQPANTADDGAGAAAPTATTTSDTGGAGPVGTDPGAGGSSDGGTTDPGAGGTTDPGPGGSSAGGAGAGGGGPAPMSPAQLVAAGDAAGGKKLYEANNCSGCHGSKEKPNAKFPNLYKLSWDDKQIEKAFEIIKKGKPPMPHYHDKLDDKKIADVVAFLKQSVGK